MVDLYKDVDWDALIETTELDVFELTREIKVVSQEFERTNEFKELNLKKPEIDQTYSNYVLVMGLPRVPEGKVDKIKTFFVKLILPKKGLMDQVVSIEVEFVEGDDLSTGNAILQFQSADAARAAQEKLNDFKMDKKHTFTAITFDGFNDIMQESEKLQEIELYQKEELLEYIDDEHNRDQVVVLVNDIGDGEKSAIETYWHNDVEGNVESIERLDNVKAKDFIQSPSTCYLATLHSKGFSILAGKDLSVVRNFTHYGVKEVKFSKGDRYIASYNGVTNAVNGSQNIIVWDLLSGQKLRYFPCHSSVIFDLFDWSHDEKYAASIVRNNETNFLCVYEAETMSMVIDKSKKRRPVQVEDPQTFKWANHKNEIVFVAYNSQIGQEKTSAGIVKVPSGDILSWIGLNFLVNECRLQWEQRDRYILVYFDATLRRREQIIQLATPDYRRMQVDVKVLTLSDIEKFVVNVSVDNKGKSFAVFWTKNEKVQNYSCTYYRIKYNQKKKNIEVKESMFLENCGYRDIEWSNIDNLFFFKQRDSIAIGNFEDCFAKKKDKFVGILKEVNISSINWTKYDSSGRFIGIYESNINKFSVFNSFGLLRFVKTFKTGKRVIWRDVPYVPVDHNVEKKILSADERNNMKPLIDKYAEADKQRREKFKDIEKKKRQIREKKFFERMNKAKQAWKETKKERIELYGIDRDNIKDGVLVYYQDKREEYERKAIGL